MAHSVKAQMIYAINEATCYGESKRSATGGSGRDAGWKIYSVSHHGDLCTTAKSFGNWLKETHPNVKRVRDVKPEMISGYLASREGVTRETGLKIRAHLAKIEKVCNHQYGKCEWRAKETIIEIPKGSSLRSLSASDDDFKAVVKAMQTGRSENWKAPVLGRYAGTRVREASHLRVDAIRPTGGQFGFGQIVLSGKEDGTKGGRPRTVDIMTVEGRDALLEVCRGIKPGGLIISKTDGSMIKPDSIDRALSRAVSRAGLDPSEWKQNGVHSFRKAFAQEAYDLVRLAGGSEKEADTYVNRQLGHGDDRQDLTDRYVSNRW